MSEQNMHLSAALPLTSAFAQRRFMHVPVPTVTGQVLATTNSGGPPRTSFQAKSGVALISQLCFEKRPHEKGGDHFDHANSSRCSAGWASQLYYL